MDHAKVAHRIRERIAEVSGKVSAGLPKTAHRMVREVLYGMESRDSLRLSKMARSLDKKTSMRKEIERLSRQLDREGLRVPVRENLLQLAAKRVDTASLLVVDPTDISKPYAEKMQYLARVKDGSAGKLRDGYWCC